MKRGIPLRALEHSAARNRISPRNRARKSNKMDRSLRNRAANRVADHLDMPAFAEALKANGLLSPYHAGFRLPNGSRRQMNGFCAVDEQAFRALPADVVTEWHAKGWLDLAALHLASLQAFQSLPDLSARRAHQRRARA